MLYVVCVCVCVIVCVWVCDCGEFLIAYADGANLEGWMNLTQRGSSFAMHNAQLTYQLPVGHTHISRFAQKSCLAKLQALYTFNVTIKSVTVKTTTECTVAHVCTENHN